MLSANQRGTAASEIDCDTNATFVLTRCAAFRTGLFRHGKDCALQVGDENVGEASLLCVLPRFGLATRIDTLLATGALELDGTQFEYLRALLGLEPAPMPSLANGRSGVSTIQSAAAAAPRPANAGSSLEAVATILPDRSRSVIEHALASHGWSTEAAIEALLSAPAGDAGAAGPSSGAGPSGSQAPPTAVFEPAGTRAHGASPPGAQASSAHRARAGARFVAAPVVAPCRTDMDASC